MIKPQKESSIYLLFIEDLFFKQFQHETAKLKTKK